MRAYKNGFWLFNTDSKRVAQILGRDMRNDGEDKFAIDSMYAACENKGKEYELARMCGKKAFKKEKTRAELETEEALDEEFIW